MGEIIRVNFRRRKLEGILFPETLHDLNAVTTQLNNRNGLKVSEEDINKLTMLADLCHDFLEIYDQVESDLPTLQE